MFEAALNAPLGVAKGLARLEDRQGHAIDANQAQRTPNAAGLGKGNTIVKPVVGAVAVHPQPTDRVCQCAEVTPLQLRDALPVVIGVQEPVLLLVVLGLRRVEGHVHDIEQPRVAAVRVLALVLRNLLVLPRTHRSDPADAFVSGKLDASNAAAVELARVSKAHNALDYRHGPLLLSIRIGYPVGAQRNTHTPSGIGQSSPSTNCFGYVPNSARVHQSFVMSYPYRRAGSPRCRPSSRS